MARKGKDPERPLDEPAQPLPVEAEEGSADLQYGQWTALGLGALFLVIAVWMVLQVVPVLQQKPGLTYPEIPVLALAFFVVGGVVDLTVGITARSGALALWHQGKFDESSKLLRGWRAILSTATGGVLPGLFLYRTANRIQPLVELERGGLPPPGTMAMAPMPGPGPVAPYSPPPPSPAPVAPMPSGSGGYSDAVAPDPMGGSRGPPGTPPAYGAPTPASLWSRPATPTGGRPNTTSSVPPSGAGYGGPLRSCPACQAPLDPDSRFCKACGAAAPA